MVAVAVEKGDIPSRIYIVCLDFFLLDEESLHIRLIVGGSKKPLSRPGPNLAIKADAVSLLAEFAIHFGRELFTCWRILLCQPCILAFRETTMCLYTSFNMERVFPSVYCHLPANANGRAS